MKAAVLYPSESFLHTLYLMFEALVTSSAIRALISTSEMSLGVSAATAATWANLTWLVSTFTWVVGVKLPRILLETGLLDELPLLD